jgi:acyl-CoA thioester hydrolase
MARVKLELPACDLFSCDLPVRITDINYGNHLGNHALLGLLHEARLMWLRHSGFKDEINIAGAGLILSDATLVFMQEAFYGDVLHIRLGVDEISKTRFELYYDVQISGATIAKAKLTMACFNYDERKIVSLPAPLRYVLEGAQTGNAQ